MDILERKNALLIEQVLMCLLTLTDEEGRRIWLPTTHKIDLLRGTEEALENMKGDAKQLMDRFGTEA